MVKYRCIANPMMHVRRRCYSQSKIGNHHRMMIDTIAIADLSACQRLILGRKVQMICRQKSHRNGISSAPGPFVFLEIVIINCKLIEFLHFLRSQYSRQRIYDLVFVGNGLFIACTVGSVKSKVFPSPVLITVMNSIG